MNPIEIQAIRDFNKRVMERALKELQDTKRLEGAHMRALKRELEEAEQNFIESKPEVERLAREAEKQRKLELKAVEKEFQGKLEALEAEKVILEEKRNALTAERVEVNNMRSDLVAREVILDTDRKRYFERQIIQARDIVQINPDFTYKPQFRGCLAIVTEALPGAVRCFVQNAGPKDKPVQGDFNFITVTDRWYKKVGQIYYEPTGIFFRINNSSMFANGGGLNR